MALLANCLGKHPHILVTAVFYVVLSVRVEKKIFFLYIIDIYHTLKQKYWIGSWKYKSLYVHDVNMTIGNEIPWELVWIKERSADGVCGHPTLRS